MPVEFGDYLIFANESGDHGLVTIDPQFPVFALIFCLVRKDDYIDLIVPAIQRLKMEIWGHDQVIFHEHDIRKEKGVFTVLRTNATIRNHFIAELSGLMERSPFKIIAALIDKNRLTQKYDRPYNPYEIAMLFCMERALGFLRLENQAGKEIPVIFESRGKREDAELELEFRRICDNRSNWGYKSPDFQQIRFAHHFADKKSNTTGLQLADLVARPLALKYLRGNQANRAHQVIEPKLLDFRVFP